MPRPETSGIGRGREIDTEGAKFDNRVQALINAYEGLLQRERNRAVKVYFLGFGRWEIREREANIAQQTNQIKGFRIVGQSSMPVVELPVHDLRDNGQQNDPNEPQGPNGHRVFSMIPIRRMGTSRMTQDNKTGNRV
eukprot:1707563-Rhodomonas_salina.1